MKEKTVIGWDVLCDVDAIFYDATRYVGKLYTPKMHYPDMRRTIQCFKAIDPEVKAICIFEDGELDLIYQLDTDSGEWGATRQLKG